MIEEERVVRRDNDYHRTVGIPVNGVVRCKYCGKTIGDVEERTLTGILGLLGALQDKDYYCDCNVLQKINVLLEERKAIEDEIDELDKAHPIVKRLKFEEQLKKLKDDLGIDDMEEVV